MNEERYDICECGDYRHQHAERGKGECALCGRDLGGYHCCRQFRLWKRMSATWTAVKR